MSIKDGIGGELPEGIVWGCPEGEEVFIPMNQDIFVGITTIYIAPEIIANQLIQGETTNITCIENGVPKGSKVVGYGYHPIKRCWYIEFSREDNLAVELNPIFIDNTQVKSWA